MEQILEQFNGSGSGENDIRFGSFHFVIPDFDRESPMKVYARMPYLYEIK